MNHIQFTKTIYMPLSKIKSSKQSKRLNARKTSWENMRGELQTPNKKKINKQEFTRPGSNNK